MTVIALPDELLALRDSVRQFIEREVRPVEQAHRDDYREHGTIPHDVATAERRRIRKRSVDAGFYTMHLPEEVGGMGVPKLGTTLVNEAIAASGLFLAELGAIVPNVEGPTEVLLALNEQQRQRYLYPLMRAERETCFALTEPEAGSDATSIATRAVEDGGDWVISGRKHFITNGQHADFIQLFAVTDPARGVNGGITFFLVDRDLDGVSVTGLQRTIGADLPAELVFEDVRVPSECVVGEVGLGFRLAMSWINSGRINVAALALGKAQHLVDRMVSYAKERRAFGQPIGRYQFVQQHVVDSVVEVRLVRNLVYEAADAVDRGSPEARQLAAAAKLAATEMVARVADRAIQVHGGSGLTTEMQIERFYRDVRAMRIYEGTSEVLRGTIAKTLGLT
jgi:acyl-CoA dehydrogenase